jgi:hypothetical protein
LQNYCFMSSLFYSYFPYWDTLRDGPDHHTQRMAATRITLEAGR